MMGQAVAVAGLGALLWAAAWRARLAGGSTDAELAPLDLPEPIVEPAPVEWLTFTAPARIGVAAGEIPSTWRWPAAAEPYRPAIMRAAEGQGIPADLLARVLYQESRFRDDIISGRTRSSAGAIGIAQFMPGTARDLGIDPLNVDQAIAGAARYLRMQLDNFGDWTRALAAYNWGPGNVQRRGLDRAPAETREYVKAVLGDVPA